MFAKNPTECRFTGGGGDDPAIRRVIMPLLPRCLSVSLSHETLSASLPLAVTVAVPLPLTQCDCGTATGTGIGKWHGTTTSVSSAPSTGPSRLRLFCRSATGSDLSDPQTPGLHPGVHPACPAGPLLLFSKALLT